MKMSDWERRRKEPFTEKGILRKKCIRCGKRARYQWQMCSDNNNYRPICFRCDIKLNALVLKFMKHPHANQLANEYERFVNE